MAEQGVVIPAGQPVMGVDPSTGKAYFLAVDSSGFLLPGAASQYETVAASQTDQIMGATGAVGDYLAGVLIVPGTTGAGTVSIKDGNGSSINIFVAGTLADLTPIYVPIGARCLAAVTPGWKITTGANVTAIGFGKFT